MDGQGIVIVGIGFAVLAGIGFYRRRKLVRLARERGRKKMERGLSFLLFVFNGMTLLLGVSIIIYSLVK